MVPRGTVFETFWYEIGYKCHPFWSESLKMVWISQKQVWILENQENVGGYKVTESRNIIKNTEMVTVVLSLFWLLILIQEVSLRYSAFPLSSKTTSSKIAIFLGSVSNYIDTLQGELSHKFDVISKPKKCLSVNRKIK